MYLQVLIDGEWKYVFYFDPRTREIIPTDERELALPG